MTDYKPFNPLDKKNLGISVAEALLVSEPHPLGELDRFNGAGIYAICYHGDFQPYRKLAANSLTEITPLYVGKAIPPGARQGGYGVESDPGPALHKRLREHADSIRAARNTLDLDHFSCHFLVVDDIWIPLGESLLIAKFSPLWNKLVDGFGNHDPGRGRYNQMRSRWDVLHPGRAWADRCQQRPETSEQIIAEVEAFLANF